jgi:hypothetical protein
VATGAKVVADEADKQRRHKTAAWYKALAYDANKQRCLESAKCATASATKALTKEQCCQELAGCAAVLAENTLANEHCCREAAVAMRSWQNWRLPSNSVAMRLQHRLQ